MNPVFQREIRTQARGKFAWRLRMGVAGLGMGLMGWLAWTSPEMFVGSGRMAFQVVNLCAAVLLGLVTPVLTHDVLSRETREGTLGLLCGTPLTSREMVLGKASVGVIQAFGAWLALAPILILPLLQGGVRIADVVLMLSLQAAAIVVGLGAGLAASSWNRKAGWALFVAYCMVAGVGMVVFVPVAAMLAAAGFRGGGGSEFVVACVVIVVAGAIGLGLLRMAGQEAEHTWGRIKLLGDVADEILMESGRPELQGKVWQASVAPAQGSTGLELTFPADGERAAPPAVLPPEPVPTPEPSVGWWEASRRRRLRKLRDKDPWLWVLTYRVDPAFRYAWILIGAYFWWLTLAVGRATPTWPESVIPICLCLRLPLLLRAEHRSGMIEVLMTAHGANELPGAVGRLLWREFGPSFFLHVGLTVIAGLCGYEGALRLGPLVVAGSLWAAPWVGLWVVGRLRGYLVGVLVVTLMLHKVGWMVGWGISLVVARSIAGNGGPTPDDTRIAEHVIAPIQILFQIGFGLLARSWVRARMGFGAQVA